MFYYSDFFS